MRTSCASWSSAASSPPKDAERFYKPAELQSPAGIEKTLKRMENTQTQFLLDGLINKPTGKPSLAAAADLRCRRWRS